MLRILVVGLVLLVAAAVMLPRPRIPPPEAATEYAQALALPAFELTDDAGRRLGPEQLAERFTLMFFGFTHCPDVCPLSLQVLASAVAQLRDSGGIAPEVLLVSVDPDRDTPARLRAYLDNFDASFRGATAPSVDLDPLISRFGVTVMRQTLDGQNYNMVHNPQVFVIGPRAELIAIISRAADADLVAQDFRRIRQRYLRGELGSTVSQ